MKTKTKAKPARLAKRLECGVPGPPAAFSRINGHSGTERTCTECGCTDSHACEPTCYWLLKHLHTNTGLCSACAMHSIGHLANAINDSDLPFVILASRHPRPAHWERRHPCRQNTEP